MRSADAAEKQARGRGRRRPSPDSRDSDSRPSEAYGFVGSVAAALAYLAWTYAPEPWLRSLGATCCPSKHWALAVPAFVAVAVAQGMVLYLASNFLLAPPPAYFATIFDEHARERGAASAPGMGAEKPIQPISDIGIDNMNHLMFGNPNGLN